MLEVIAGILITALVLAGMRTTYELGKLHGYTEGMTEARDTLIGIREAFKWTG